MTFRFDHIDKNIVGDATEALKFINGQVGAAHRNGGVLVSMGVVAKTAEEIHRRTGSLPPGGMGVYGVAMTFRYAEEAA